MTTSMIRSLLSTIHFCARRKIRPRPSKPIASQPGWASRPRAPICASSSAPTIGTVEITSPVAGFSTVIVACWAPPSVPAACS
jgi:hypothetical protein